MGRLPGAFSGRLTVFSGMPQLGDSDPRRFAVWTMRTALQATRTERLGPLLVWRTGAVGTWVVNLRRLVDSALFDLERLAIVAHDRLDRLVEVGHGGAGKPAAFRKGVDAVGEAQDPPYAAELKTVRATVAAAGAAQGNGRR